ncbi:MULTISPECIES: P1 family peptidase [unclassified Streptomyces]|uniref:P1 family peptidase n=2 Tax=Streptomyces TaxID=1883 RepID=UPI001AF92951|nr:MULTISPECIES: P1 family peptidase [unclassified Streptomyces]CAD5960610.1 Putative aminopeptidase [Streptomyces sp. KY75]CAD5980228.1 Putative aminopeptidase [Streptomyces sp. KY70]
MTAEDPHPPLPDAPSPSPSTEGAPSPEGGPLLDALTDVAGVRVGHAQVGGAGALSGTTVVLAPEGGAVAAVDVRGGGPGTRETDALDPRNLVQRVDAIVLTGGSAYGLDAASGVVAWLEEQGRGVRVGAEPGQVVPVVPAAALFDLGRGGDWRARPDASTGRAAVEAAAASEPRAPVAEGNVGAGTGAVAGQLKGGIGTASVRLASGVTVAALVAVNAAGSVLDPRTGVLFGEYGAGEPPAYPAPATHAAAVRRLAREREAAGGGAPPFNTTIAVVATDADLVRAQAQKLAGTAHDGMARAVRPVHLLTDGDTVFALATGRVRVESENPVAVNEILAAGADVLARAIVKAVRAARSIQGSGGTFLAHADLYGEGPDGRPEA